MKTINKFLLPLAVVAMLFASCGQESPIEEAAKKGELGFNTLLNDFLENGRLTDELPDCSENGPYSVCVKIKDANGNYIMDKTPEGDDDGLDAGSDNIIEIDVAPASGVDIDNDGDMDTWFTEESESLELPEGDYTIEYFVVKDEDGNAVLAAPHEDADFGDVKYQNFVEDALPISLTLFAGTKKYVDVEVLCFEEHFAKEFGYLFFDIIEIEQQHICIFGNVCDDNGRHHPANFIAKVWTEEGGDLLFEGSNEFGINNAGEEYAKPLCIPLPDREEVEETFYGEVHLIFNGDTSQIRQGTFTEADIKALYANSDTSHYWHFREGCEECDDDPRLLDGCNRNPGERCYDDYRETILGFGITETAGNTPPNLTGIYDFNSLLLITSNLGDAPGSTFADKKIRITDWTQTAQGAEAHYERTTGGTGTAAPNPAYITGEGDNFSLYTCADVFNSTRTDSIRLTLLYTGTLDDGDLVDVTYVILNVNDYDDPAGNFIGEGQGRYIEESDGVAEATNSFRLNSTTLRTGIADVLVE